MQTTWLLARDGATLWHRSIAGLGTWFCLGYAGNLAGQQLSTWLSVNRVAATLVFILGTVWWVACLALMVHSVESRLPAVGRNADGSLCVGRSRLDILGDGLGPFLAVFSVWGFVESQWRALFVANLATYGLSADLYSVNLSDWPMFAAFAATAWVMRRVLTVIGPNSNSRGLALLRVLADAVVVLAGFAVLFALGRRFWGWFAERAVAQWLRLAQDGLLAALPSWPWLSDLVSGLLDSLSTVLPAVVATAVLPLLWVSLVGVVFGWRDFTARGLAAGTRVESVAARLGDGEDVSGPAGRVWLWLTGDLRDKYLPVAHGLRLVLAQGLGFVGALVGLSAAFGLAMAWVEPGIERLIGPQSLAVTLAYQPLLGLVAGFLATSGQVALYATAFDRGLAARVPVMAGR